MANNLHQTLYLICHTQNQLTTPQFKWWWFKDDSSVSTWCRNLMQIKCIWEKHRYLEGIVDDSVIVSDEIISVINNV